MITLAKTTYFDNERDLKAYLYNNLLAKTGISPMSRPPPKNIVSKLSIIKIPITGGCPKFSTKQMNFSFCHLDEPSY